METKFVKIVTTVPKTHADVIRQAMSDAGAGILGNYTNCSISSDIIGRFKPVTGANPFSGELDVLESVIEEKIEMTCERSKIKEVFNALKQVHPYEEVVFDVYPLEDLNF
jgi:hypothetical protein